MKKKLVIKPKKRRHLIKILQRIYPDTCCYCNEQLTDATRTIEHVVARRDGGTNDISNLRLCCNYCNNLHMNPSEAHLRPKKVISKIEWRVRIARRLYKQQAKSWHPAIIAVA